MKPGRIRAQHNVIFKFFGCRIFKDLDNVPYKRVRIYTRGISRRLHLVGNLKDFCFRMRNNPLEFYVGSAWFPVMRASYYKNIRVYIRRAFVLVRGKYKRAKKRVNKDGRKFGWVKGNPITRRLGLDARERLRYSVLYMLLRWWKFTYTRG